ncbi:ATP-binding protein [Nonomuraea sp. M3C6]|uniref:histidine kinase n=1 Tax=Nonomuraea marmarensis TaxID=3351344 RepID=A0ABW7AJ64_9ACTN
MTAKRPVVVKGQGSPMEWKHVPLRVSAALTSAAVTALESAGVSVLFLRLMHRQRAAISRDRFHLAVDRVFFLLRKGYLPAVLPNRYGHAIQVVDARRRVISATRSLRGRPPMAGFAPPRGHVHGERVLDGRMTVRSVLIVPELCRRQGVHGPAIIYAAAPRVPWYGSRGLAVTAAGAAAVVTGLAGWGAYQATVRALAPVEDIRAELADITATDLSARIPVPHHQELRLMAQTMNTTLSRLQSAVDHLRRFASEASHDLRSPLAGIRTRLEEALMDPEHADWPEVARQVLAGVERQQAIITDMLDLARLDTGGPFHRVPTDLAQLIGTELRQRTGDRVPTAQHLRDGVIVDCDRLLVARVLANLLDNAQRHATTAVTVTVRAQGRAAVLEVADDGEGIPPEHRDKVFERFTRLHAARTRDPTGTGLGLPIAREIVHAHHGTLTIEDNAPGARLVMRIPRCAPPDTSPS